MTKSTILAYARKLYKKNISIQGNLEGDEVMREKNMHEKNPSIKLKNIHEIWRETILCEKKICEKKIIQDYQSYIHEKLNLV